MLNKNMRLFPALYVSPIQKCAEYDHSNSWCVKYVGKEQYYIHTYENYNKYNKYMFSIIVFACIFVMLLNSFITKNILEDYAITIVLPAVYLIIFLLLSLYSYTHVVRGKTLIVFGLILFLIVVCVSTFAIAKTPTQIYSLLSLNIKEDTSLKYILIGDVLVVLVATVAILKLMWRKRNVEQIAT